MQKLRFSKYIKGILILFDILVIIGIFTLFFTEQDRIWNFDSDTKEQSVFFIILLVLFWLLLSGSTKLYNVPRNLTYTLYLERFTSHTILFIFGILLLAKVSNTNMFLKTERATLSFILFGTLLLLKTTIFFGIKYLRTKGVNHRNIMFIGNSNDAQKIIEHTIKARKDYGYKIFDYPKKEININELIDFWKENGIHTLFISINENNIAPQFLDEIKNEALLNHVKIALIPNIISDSTFNKEITYLETQPILVPAKLPLDFFSNYLIKRIFDIIFSLIVLIGICSWLFPIIATIIKFTSKGDVFFIQKRYGYKDEVFYCLKFRTMTVNEFSDAKVTDENDDRITKFGHILRKTSLDELPQFINVLKGEMSVVGPRPHMLTVDDFYKTKIGRYTARSLTKPGITGLAQVNGLRGDQGNRDIEMKKRILADVFYVKNWTIVLDIIIILKTILLMIKGDKKAK